MGRILRVARDLVLPTEPGIRGKSIWAHDPEGTKNVRYFFKRGEEDLLLPVAVRVHHDGEHYVTLDGRNRMVLNHLYDIDPVPIYVAERADDFMDARDFPHVPAEVVAHSNSYIQHLFRVALVKHEEIFQKGEGTYASNLEYVRQGIVKACARERASILEQKLVNQGQTA